MDHDSSVQVVVKGHASGPVLASHTPLSFWGDIDPCSGQVINPGHELYGQSITGKILVLPSGRGSCTSSLALLECMIRGFAPAAIFLQEPDDIIALGVILVEEFFDRSIPLLVFSPEVWALAARASDAEVLADGAVNLAGIGRVVPASKTEHEIELSPRDELMLSGGEGEAPRRAMRVILRMARVMRADRLIDIEQVHIDACGFPGLGAIKMAEMLVGMGGHFRVRTTMNAIPMEPGSARLVHAFVGLGAQSTLTCAPYQLPDLPKCGEHVAWSESNAVVYANSVLSLRTNRYGDGLEVCIALTGRAPLAGLHLRESRRPTVRVRLPRLRYDSSVYPVLGYLIGKRVGKGIPYIENAPVVPELDDLKAFGAALASSGSVGLFYIAGFTPEAPSPAEVAELCSDIWEITESELRDTWAALTRNATGLVDAVIFGSPHLSLRELEQLYRYFRGLNKDPRVNVVITVGRHVYNVAKETGMVEGLRLFGARILTDTCSCFFTGNTLSDHVRRVLTPSVKFAHYGPALLRKNVVWAPFVGCIQAAISGYYELQRPGWVVED